MDAIEFVKTFGLEWAEHAVDNMPKKWSECYLRITDLEFVKSPPSVSDWVCVYELKQIIEAFELVEKHGGLDEAIEATGTSYIKPSDWEDLNNAINILEKCKND